MTSRSPYLLLIVFLFAPGLVHGASVTAPYAIDFSTFAAGDTGKLALIENDNTGVFHMYSGDTLPIAAGTTYDMILRGHAHDGELDLTGIASNGIKTVSLLFSDDNTPRTGKNFGLTASA